MLALDPNDSLLQLQGLLDRFFRNPALGFDAYGTAEAGVFPPINVFRDEEGIVVRAEVPGLRSEDLDITIEKGRLLISGERKAAELQGGSCHRHERPAGRFSRALRLPDDLDPAACKASCRNGVLTVRIPRQERAKPRRIKVE
jgi:HSP20 family protein